MIAELSFIQGIFAELLIGAFDYVVYNVLSAVYYIFLQVSKLNLFGGSVSTAMDIYDGFTSRVYTVLSIVMVFVLAYQITLMIINPDTKADKSTNLIKDIIISLIFIALCPTIFGYMAVFQEHVIADGTITAMVLGTNGGSGKNPGRTLAMVMYTSMYHPIGSGYSTFVDNEGKLIDTPVTYDGTDYPKAVYDCIKNGSREEICTTWYNSMSKWTIQPGSSIGVITKNSKAIEAIGEPDGTDYLWVLCTAAGAVVIWLIASYTIDLGTRAVKLGFLQLIAPIALIFRVIPSMKKNFDKWLNELIKTYIDVFLKLFVISFVVQICILVPSFIEIIFHSADNVEGPLFKGIAIICLILGLLSFAKEAPSLLKELFGGNDMFSGLNFKPGVKDRLNSNDYAKKGASMLTQGAAGALGNAHRRREEYRKAHGTEMDAAKGLNKLKHGAAYIGTGALGFIRGAGTGGANGLKNSQSEFSIAETLKQAKQGAEHASMEGKKHDEAWGKTYNKVNGAVSGKVGGPAGKVGGAVAGFVSAVAANSMAGNAIHDWGDDISDNANALNKSWGSVVATGTKKGMNSEAATLVEGINQIVNNISNHVTNEDIESVESAYTKAIEKFRTDKKAKFNGRNFTSEADLKAEFENVMKSLKTTEYSKQASTVDHQKAMGEQLAKLLEENMDKFGTNMQKALEKVASDNLGTSDIVQGIENLTKTTDARNAASNEKIYEEISKVLNEGLKQQREMEAAKAIGKPAPSSDEKK